MNRRLSLKDFLDEAKKTWQFSLGDKTCTLIMVLALYRRVNKRLHKVYGSVSIYGRDLVVQGTAEKASMKKEDFEHFWEHRASIPRHYPLLPDFVFYLFPKSTDSKGYFNYVQQHIDYPANRVDWMHDKFKFDSRIVYPHMGAFFLVRLT